MFAKYFLSILFRKIDQANTSFFAGTKFSIFAAVTILVIKQKFFELGN
jgi:hypothetical protein